ncbi:MAG TPA: hypothetical protein DCY59_10075, partial [Micrococcaceae bacterium]|nr:hypothetical protein [Micrococcaceae bacterium]
MFWFIVVVLLVALSFFIGYRAGAKKHSAGAQAKQQAWQEGYDAATSYAAREAAKQAAASKASPTAQPQPAWTRSNDPMQGPRAEASAPPTLKPAAPVAPARPVKVLTARERELRNINVTLYVAALLIVAAAALFLSFALPPLPKLIALFVLAAAFYSVGLYVHAAKENLKPAASAFAGTGLALLPLSAIATYQTLSLSVPVVWLIFSVIGTLAVGFATIQLRSRVLAWIAVFVLVSTTMACAATVQRGILFYLLFLLVLSVVLLVLAVRSEKVRSSLFYSAVFATGQLLPLLVLGLALIMYSSLTPRDLLWVFFLVTAHLLLTIVLIGQFRLYRLYAARVTFMLLVFAAGNYLGLEAHVTWALGAVLWAGQALAVTHFARGYRQLFSVPASWWRIDRMVLWVLVAGSVLVALAQAAQPQVPWWYAVLLIALLQVFSLPALHHRGKIEAVAIVLLAHARGSGQRTIRLAGAASSGGSHCRADPCFPQRNAALLAPGVGPDPLARRSGLRRFCRTRPAAAADRVCAAAGGRARRWTRCLGVRILELGLGGGFMAAPLCPVAAFHASKQTPASAHKRTPHPLCCVGGACGDDPGLCGVAAQPGGRTGEGKLPDAGCRNMAGSRDLPRAGQCDPGRLA